MAGLVIKPRARIFHGHDWVYISDVLKTFGSPEDGGVVSLKDGRDRLLGSAIYNSRSQIVARRFSRQRQELDADFFKRRIALALEYRRRHGLADPMGRIVWSESDGLPGVIIDRYGEDYVLQTLTLAMDQRRDLITGALRELVNPRTVLERNDSLIRKAEGLEMRTGVLHGAPPAAQTIEVDSLRFEIDLLAGQKTGFYLDQLPNYAAVARYAANRAVLDCFCNQGAFALHCARAGARSVTAVDVSSEAVAATARNAGANALAVDAVEANVFDDLHRRERAGESFDLIILDPPSFTKSKGHLKDALRGYKEIHLRALKLLRNDGLLATFCCSHHVNSELFLSVINEASVDAKRTLRLLHTYAQGLDHPVISTLPESSYLKGFLLELVPGR